MTNVSNRNSFLSPLGHQTYRQIWTATIASNLGGLIQGVGAAWTMASISPSENMVALVQASTTAPLMLFSLLSGAIADNFDRRRVMLAAQYFMFTTSVILTIVAYFGLITPWTLLAFTFLIGCGTALNNPSWQASVGDMVPREDLPGAVSLNSMGFNITRSIGPAIGGMIVAAAGGVAAFAINALSYFPLVFVLSRWRPAVSEKKLPREDIGPAISAGLRYVAMSPNLGKVVLRSFVFGLTASAILALLPVVARDMVKGGPLTYGIMLGAFGAGAIVGAMLNARLREQLTSENIVRLAFAGFAVSAAVIGASETAVVSSLALLLAGACWVLALSLFNTVVQLSTPRWVVGRALSLYQTAAFGGMASGSWLWGSMAESHGVTAALFASSLLMFAGVAIGFWLTMPAFASLDLDPLDRFSEPSLRLDIRPRSGPIVIQIDYEIQDEDVPEFLALMVERRRIRIRDGARNWGLMRDLESPDVWTETYHTPTWADYLRHNHRRTMADAENSDRLLALHRGEKRPRVHRMIERQAIPGRHDVFHQAHIEPH